MPIYAKLPNIKGEVTLTDYPGWVELTSLQFGVTNTAAPAGGGSGTGKPSASDIDVTKTLDTVTVPVLRDLLVGATLPRSSSRSPRGTPPQPPSTCATPRRGSCSPGTAWRPVMVAAPPSPSACASARSPRLSATSTPSGTSSSRPSPGTSLRAGSPERH